MHFRVEFFHNARMARLPMKRDGLGKSCRRVLSPGFLFLILIILVAQRNNIGNGRL